MATEKEIEMSAKVYRVNLKPAEREQLVELTQKGTVKVRKYKRAQALLLADEAQVGGGQADESIMTQVGLSLATVERIRQRFAEGGLSQALNEAPRPGRPRGFSGKQRAEVTALACSTPPDGYGRWSLRLLADKLVELEIVESISPQSVQAILKKTNSNRI